MQFRNVAVIAFAILVGSTMATTLAEENGKEAPLVSRKGGEDNATSQYSKGEFSIVNLVARIRETGAIGFFTKLALKNQIDDLVSEFREFHAEVSDIELSVLNDQFNLLLMKVITLLQDDDSKLFQDIVNAREFLWMNLADPEMFARL